MNPLSAIYAAGVELRNEFYDRGILVARKLASPVISVGSISAGGAGKTPFVIFLGDFLKRHGIRVDVLSRGYGRKSRGVRVVHENGSPAEFGDEPLLIARHLDCPVVVGESRYEAGLRAEIEFGSQVHLLDDGFQHRSLKRDLDIVLLTSADLQDTLLPTGRLREPLGALHRADVVAVTSGLDVTRLRLHQKIVWGLRRAIRLQGMTQKPVVFCGIARPQKFFRELRELGVEAVAHSIFPDHHAYTGDDVEHLLRLAQQNRAGGFITTEKDLVNLGERAEDLGDLTIAQITIQIEPADALDTVLEVVTNRELQREKIRGQ